MHKIPIALHIIAWFLWFTYQTLPYIGNPIPLWPTLYSFGSWLIVFYACCFFTRRFLRSVSITDAAQLPRNAWLKKMLVNWLLLALFGVLAVYLSITRVLDSWFYNTGQIDYFTKNIYQYCTLRGSFIGQYIIGGVMVAQINHLLYKKEKLRQMHNARYKLMQGYLNSATQQIKRNGERINELNAELTELKNN